MTKKSEKKRDRILNAAVKQMCLHGYAKTTLDDIANEVGLTKTALYYYFKSKEDLVTKLADKLLLEFSTNQRRILLQEKPLVDRLCDLIEWRATFSKEILATYENVTDDIFLIVPFLKERITAHKEASIVILTEEIHREMAKTKLCPVDPPAFAAIFEFMLHSIEARLYSHSLHQRVIYSEEMLITQLQQMVRRTLLGTNEQ